MSLLNDFPDSKELFEYEDYVKKPNFKNGSALISEIIDRNMDWRRRITIYTSISFAGRTAAE